MLNIAPRGSRSKAPGLASTVLAAARRILLREGVEALTARKIASEARCTPPAIYFHYRNLDELKFRLRMEGHAILARYLRQSQRRGDSFERLRAMGAAYLRFGLENPQFYELMFLTRTRQLAKREEIQQEMFTLMMLRDLIAAGVERGEMRRGLDLMTVTNAIWAQVHGVTSLAVQNMLSLTAPNGAGEILLAISEAADRWLRA
jgi:AcrR family transcriptional regulator